MGLRRPAVSFGPAAVVFLDRRRELEVEETDRKWLLVLVSFPGQAAWERGYYWCMN